jgi:1-deoxy-D-xylulose 5-phosphate reductoisomerase
VDIPVLIEEVVSETRAAKLESIKEVLRVDQQARASARERVARLGTRVPVAARHN